jgi:segregation and condensation protein B
MVEEVNRRTIQLVEALLFLENGPVNMKHLVQVTGKKRETIRTALGRIGERLKSIESSLTIIENDKGDYQLTIIPELYEILGKRYDTRKKLNLSPQALETLAIIAYKQPITRAEIEKIRGVGVDHVLRLLMEHEMIRICGRKDVPGKPSLYATTKNFLTFFGLLSLKDLPSIEEFERS